MVYRLSTFPPEEQLAFLDQVAAVGFRVMYDVGQQQDDCGDPKFNNTRGNETCFSDPNSPPLVKLKQSIDLVKGHPALLGYCESDTFSTPCSSAATKADTLFKDRTFVLYTY